MDTLLSPNNAAELLGLRPRTIRVWLRLGKLKGNKLGSVWRIPIHEVNRLLRRDQVPSPKHARVPTPILRLQLEDGNTLTFLESTEGLVLVVINGKPRSVIYLDEFAVMIQRFIAASGSNKAIAELVGA